MQILNVKVQDFKGVQLIEIVPNKTTTVIGGRNRQGKSSLLDAVAAALGGKKLCPAKPIRDGQDRARIEVKLDGDMQRLIPAITVVREFFRKENGDIESTLEITTAEGYAAPSPQTLLNDCLGKLGFDPEAFLRMDGKKQAEVLRELVGLDFSDIDAQAKAVYEERTQIGREGKSLRGQLDGCAHHADAPEVEVSVLELTQKLREADEVNSKNRQRRQSVETLKDHFSFEVKQLNATHDSVAAIERRIREAQADLEDAKARISDQKKKVEAVSKAVNDRNAEIETLVDINTTELRQQIESAEATNRKVRDNLRRAEIDAQVKAKTAEWNAATAKLDQLAAKKLEMQQAAAWPVDGLGYDETGVTYTGRPFAQASSFEQRKVAMAICAALSPTLRFAFIKDGSLLDDDGLQEIAMLAAEKGVQLFVERVGHGSECSVVIEQGKVVGQDKSAGTTDGNEAAST